MGTFLLVLGLIIVVLIFLMMTMGGLSEERRQEEQELKEQERRLLTTGFSSFSFNLKGSNHCSDIARDLLQKIKQGDAVLLMPEFFNEYDRYAISVRMFGKHIGYMDRTTAFHWAEKLFTGSTPNYHLCIAKKVELNEGFDLPMVEFEVFYKDKDGRARFDFKHEGPMYSYVNPVEGCGQDLTDDITNKRFILSEISKEVVNTFPEIYGLGTDVSDDDLNEKWYEEDVQYLKEFIRDLHTGAIDDIKAKSKFLRNAAKDRVYGNNDKLKVLLNSYLEFKEVKLK